MILSSRSLTAALFGFGAFAAVIVACGSSSDSKFQDSTPPPSFFQEGGFADVGNNGLSIVRDDPPAGYCGPDSGVEASTLTVGGSAACPDDKNLPGCGCPTPGVTAACFTGYRKNRGLGMCKDGTTTCKVLDENTNVWGPCDGEVLPSPDAGGADGCNCFSVGLWKIANTAPCIWTDNGTYWSYSTIGPNADGCTTANHQPAGVPETEVWSKDTLKTDCAGSFKLCYRIRVGDFKSPAAADCTLGESCVDVVYTTSGATQDLPDLPPWATTDSACAKKWESDTPDTTSPGYGEMYVKGGETVRCDAISSVSNDSEFIFNRVEYCPKACRDGYTGAANPATIKDVCAACKLSGQGQFGH